MHLVAEPRCRHADEAVRRREADRIVDDIVDRAFEPVTVAHHDGRALARAREGDARVRGARLNARGARGEHRFDHDPDIDGLEQRARQLRVDAARLADVAHKPVEAADILVGDAKQLRALLGALDAAEPLARSEEHTPELPSLMGHAYSSIYFTKQQ